MSQKKIHNIEAIFDGPQVRKARLGMEWLYAVVDLLARADGVSEPAALWEGMKQRERSACNTSQPAFVKASISNPRRRAGPLPILPIRRPHR